MFDKTSVAREPQIRKRPLSPANPAARANGSKANNE